MKALHTTHKSNIIGSVPPFVKQPKKFKSELNERVCDLSAQGLSYNEISRMLFAETGNTISPQRVGKIIKDYKDFYLNKNEKA